jgi:S-DNA-T family DNA segregation ATPase FtsK/SpoIIIE
MPLKLPFTKSPPARGKTTTAVPHIDAKKPASKAAGHGSAPTARKSTSSKKAPPPPPPLFDISPERKLDILGIFLALGGIIVALSLLSTTRGAVTGTFLDVLGFVFGDGAVILPLALIGFGGWLVLRKIERIPPVSIERVSGFIFLLLFLQTAIHGLTGNGGWIGSLFYRMLDENLGWGGALVAMLAWLLIALIMSFDLTLPELMAKLSPLTDFINKLWTTLALRQAASAADKTVSEPVPAQDGFLPISPAKSAVPDGAQSALPAVDIGIPVTGPVKQVPWVLPLVKDILESGTEPSVNEEFVESRARLIEETLASFGAPVQVVQISRGPTITQFGVEPLFVESRAGRTRVRVSKIAGLSDDLALALAAPRIRIQAPVPGRSYVGIEVPNTEMTLVSLRDILEVESFTRNRKLLSFALGRDVSGLPIGADLAAMPHLLIAGTTGSGKSVCVNAILTSLLLYNTPDEVRMVLVDPKRVELTGYNGIPHLLAPVVVEMEKVLGALQWMTREMDRRYHTFAQVGARNIVDYNTRVNKAQGQKKLPYLVIVIDELADLMMIAPDETERTITRLAQLARATGIHMVLATQRPSVDVVTGLIKANFPARIAFAVSSNTDSRVILDQPGAERLLGRGDMLYQSPDAPAPVRLQGVYISDHEIHRLVDFWQKQNTNAMPVTPGGPVDGAASNVPLKQTSLFGEDITAAAEQGDVLLSEAIDLVRREGRASVSMLQRKLRVGYTRAARMIDTMEERKIIGTPQDATGVRPVLDYGPAAPPKED